MGRRKKCQLHTPMPERYTERQAKMQELSRTHVQVKCPDCGKFVIWKKRQYVKTRYPAGAFFPDFTAVTDFYGKKK